MKRNQSRLIKLLLILIGIFAILIFRNESNNWRNKFFPEKITQAFPDLKKEDIEEIRVINNQITKIYKKNGDWLVASKSGDFKADPDKVEKIREGFINLRKQNIASTNKNKHIDLGIGNRKIEVKTAKKSYLLYIGSTEGLENNYVRISDQDEVFITSGFAEIFTVSDLRDLALHLISDENKVTDIEIISDGKKTALSKIKTKWLIKNVAKSASEVKKDRVDFYVNDLKTLKAQDILKKEDYSYLNPELSLTIKENGKEKIVYFYPNNEETYLVTISTDNYEYVVPTAYVASLKKEEKDFSE